MKIASNPNTDAAMTLVPIQAMLDKWKEVKAGITVESLDDAREQSIVGEVIVGDANELLVEVNYVKLKKLLPNIRFINRVIQSNQEKSAVA